MVGFRQWRLCAGELCSVYADERWTGATLRAHCPTGMHAGGQAPAGGCTCGVYAWYHRVPRLGSAGTRDLVSGAVVLWGHLELHPTAMRAEYARIVALALPLGSGHKRRALVAIAERLGVPAVPYRAVPAFAAREGRPIPDALKPKPAPRRWHGWPPNALPAARS